MYTREEIIEAIKQTAKKNGGKPPGKGVFQQKTAIKESDWSGVYWARWSDAIIEAGFEPNTKPIRIGETDLLERLIAVIRHYQKLPTTPELRLYCKEVDKKFPVSTIERRFSPRANLLSQLADYINGKPKFKDIFEICNELSIPEKEDAAKSNIKEGYVYLFKSGSHYKIGNSFNVEQRVKQIKTQMPESLTIVHTIKTDDPFGIEAYWHNRFSDKRLNGEWFKLSISDVKAFKRRKFQ